jgi:outer membrane protein assembly factor BamB
MIFSQSFLTKKLLSAKKSTQLKSCEVMNRKIATISLLLVLAFSSIATLFSANADTADTATLVDSDMQTDGPAADWPMYRHNAAHTGSSDNTAPATYDLLWSTFTLYGNGHHSGPTSCAAVVGNVAYYGSGDGSVYAFDASNGTLIWRVQLSDYSLSSTAVVGGVVYVSTWVGFDYALDAATGAIIWNVSKGQSGSSPAVANGLFYSCAFDPLSGSSLIAREASTGALVWNYTVGGNGESSPAISGERVYVKEGGYLYCFTALTGVLQWSTYIGGGSSYSSPTVAEGKVFVKNEGTLGDSTFGAYDAFTGASIWNSTVRSSDDSTPCVVNGVVYVGSSPYGLCALNANTGAQIWNFPASIWQSSPSVAGGIVYICSYDGNIYGLNAANGAQLWSYYLGHGSVSCSPTITNGVLYITDVNGYLCAFGKATKASISMAPWFGLKGSVAAISGAGFSAGSTVTATFAGAPITLSGSTVDSLGHFYATFTVPALASANYPIVATDSLGKNALSNYTIVSAPVTSWPMYMHDLQHTGTADNMVPTSNNTLWTYKVDNGEIGNQVASSAAVVEGIVYTASGNSYVYAFDAYTGRCYWKYSLPGIGTLSSPSVVDGVVYIGSDYGLFALNAYSGEKIWQAADRVLISSSAAVSGNLVFIGSTLEQGTSESAVFAFRRSDGAQVWKFTTGDYVMSSPAVVGSTVYVGSNDNWFYALNAADGSLLWKFNVSDLYPHDSCSASPAFANGVVYISSLYGNVFALNSASGSKIWNHTVDSRLGSGLSSPTLSNGILYIAAQNSIYALNATTGNEIWQSDVASYGSPTIVGGTVYATSGDGKIWAINALTGEKSLHYVTEGSIRVPVALARGVIYVGTTRGTVYAIGTPDLITPQPTPTPPATPTPTPQGTNDYLAASNPRSTNAPTPKQTPTQTPTAIPEQSTTPLPTNIIRQKAPVAPLLLVFGIAVGSVLVLGSIGFIRYKNKSTLR